MTYKKVVRSDGKTARDDMIRRDADGAFIPADPLNTDWQAYQAWLEAGNKPAEAEAAPQEKADNPAA